MKLRKRIVALGAAMTMAVSMMSIGASAESWNLYANSSNSGNQYNESFKFYPNGNPINGVNENCNIYYTVQDQYGNVGYARYWGYCTDSYGNVKTFGSFSNHFHYSTMNMHNIGLSSPIKYGYILNVKYSLNNTHINSSMSGYINKA